MMTSTRTFDCYLATIRWIMTRAAVNATATRNSLGLQIRDLAEAVMDFATGVSVRTKILGIVVSMTLMLGLGITLQVRSVLSAVLTTELDNRGVSVASDLSARAADPLLLNDPYTVHELLSDTVAHHPDAEYGYVMARDDTVVVHTFGDAGFPSALLDREAGSSGARLAHRHFEANDSVFHEFEAPILEGDAGTVHVGLSEDRIDGVVGGVTTQMLVMTGFVALLGVVAASFLTWLLTRPILELVETTRKIRHGDLTVRSAYSGSDEIGALSKAFNEMVAELQENKTAIELNEAARSRLLEKLMNAQEEERKRLARELHDTVGQSLSSLMIGISLMARMDRSRAITKSEELQAAASETLTQVRELSRDLRPSALDDLGLEAVLERCAEHYSTRYPGIEVEVHVDGIGRLPPTVETAMYRIVQEALTNAVRHGQARFVDILLVHLNGTARAIIEDDGVGFEVEHAVRFGNSVGIHAMQERAEILGGSFSIESGDSGTTVYVELPV